MGVPLTCCCCGDDAGRWAQHWNRDSGYGICMSCIRWMRARGTAEAELRDLYGVEGVNFGRTLPSSDTKPTRGQRAVEVE